MHDAQLYISVEPINPDSLCSLTACLASINQWMRNYFLKMNEDKTEILLGPKLKRDTLLASLGAWLTRPNKSKVQVSF